MNTTTKIVDPKEKEIWAPCLKCAGKTAHKCLTEVDVSDHDPKYDVQGWIQYYVVQCGGCKTISFCKESQFSEDWDFDEEGHQYLPTTQKVFPNRIAGRPLLEDINLIPHGIAEIYKETHEALAGQQPILTGIGLRAIVEAVCKTEGINEKLFKAIDELETKGILTNSGVQILHHIRILGNDAAHEVKANGQAELLAAFEVVEHLLRTIYIIPAKAAKITKS
jgi:hypothetical protein